MNELDIFINKLRMICNTDEELNINQARKVVSDINDFLYTSYDEIGTVEALGKEFSYFSDFHKYWGKHYNEILNIEINDENCEKVAEALHEVYVRTDGNAFKEVYDTNYLSKEEICRVRMLTANQDFRGSRKFSEFAKIYTNDNSIFDEKIINQNPKEFVSSLNVNNLSQNDKRIQFAKNISKFIIEENIEPYKIINNYDNDVYQVREALIGYPGSGYGNKKADIFIRDMVVLGIWDEVTGFEKIDVASDVNTIKVALRTGIISTEIPIVSSFLDIFCYQYGYVDRMNAQAWRKVWEIWFSKYPNETISSPCLLDYFIYNVVGKQFCKESLCVFQCEEYGHTFKWHSHKNKTCQICYRNNENSKAKMIGKVMPCMDIDGKIAILKTEFVEKNIAHPNYDNCPFIEICQGNGYQSLKPPKSISIMGRTGWTTGYTNKNEGGGGLMA